MPKRKRETPLLFLSTERMSLWLHGTKVRPGKPTNRLAGWLAGWLAGRQAGLLASPAASQPASERAPLFRSEEAVMCDKPGTKAPYGGIG